VHWPGIHACCWCCYRNIQAVREHLQKRKESGSFLPEKGPSMALGKERQPSGPDILSKALCVFIFPLHGNYLFDCETDLPGYQPQKKNGRRGLIIRYMENSRQRDQCFINVSASETWALSTHLHTHIPAARWRAFTPRFLPTNAVQSTELMQVHEAASLGNLQLPPF
jgi:hypothetical protein